MTNGTIFLRIIRKDGISVIALVIVLLLLGALGFVLTSLIITKQESAVLPFRSTHAFYLAQAGIEYAIRYASDQEDFDPDDTFSVTKDLGAGSFTVTYDPGDGSVTSTGTVGTAERVVKLASFTSYVAGGGITLDPENPPYQGTGGEQKNIYIPTVNNYDYDVYIFQIDLAKEEGNPARLNEIRLGDTTVWTGNKVDVSTDHDGPTPFPFNQLTYYTMASGASLDRIEVQATTEASGTWYVTFHYSEQTDLSDSETSTVTFDIS